MVSLTILFTVMVSLQSTNFGNVIVIASDLVADPPELVHSTQTLALYPLITFLLAMSVHGASSDM